MFQLRVTSQECRKPAPIHRKERPWIGAKLPQGPENRLSLVPALRGKEAQFGPVECEWLSVLEVPLEALAEPRDPGLSGEQQAGEPAGLGVVRDRSLGHRLEHRVAGGAAVHPRAGTTRR
jgi:hypothetical protein